VAVALPRRVSWPPPVRLRPLLARLAPSRRSLAIGLGILAFAFGAYGIARVTSLFAISSIEVRGGSPQLSAQVRHALAPLVGASLVGLDGTAVVRKLDALPTIVSASYDRAFPHTLRITVVPERPAAVVRSGSSSWLASGRGRIMERLRSSIYPKVPKIWVAGRTPVRVGAELTPAGGGVAARAVGLSGAFAARIALASFTEGSLVFRLRSGLELLLGDPSDVELKVGVAERALLALPAGTAYLDVSVPGRPVSGTAATATAALQGYSRG
jgi:cell division protein FtsQ